MRIPNSLWAVALLGCGSSVPSMTTPEVPEVPEVPDVLVPDELPDIEQFMSILSASSPRRAPDGTIYYTTWETGVDQLYRIPPGGGDSQILTEFEDGVEGYSLAPNGRMLTVQTSVGGSEQADLHVLDPATLAIEPILVDPEVRYENVLWLHDSSGFFYRSNEANGTDFFIYLWDLERGEASLVAESPGYNSLSDVSNDGLQLLVVRYESNANSDIYHYLRGDFVTETHLTPHEGEVEYHAPTFGPAGEIWVLSNQNVDRTGIGTLMGETGFVLYAVQSEWEGEDMVVAEDRGMLAYVTNEDGYGRPHLLELSSAAPLPDPDLGEGIASLSHFANGVLMMVYSSAVETHDVWAYDVASREVSQVTFSSYEGVDNSLFRQPELVHYTSFDGREIPAFLYLPPNYEGGIVPTIIHMHGGPESQFRPAFARHFQYLMLNGFAVLAPNIRGSSGYGPEYMALDNVALRPNAIQDIGAAADWLIEQGITDTDHLGIKGGSYGGYAVMAAITTFPDRFAAAMETVGIVNFVSFLENTADYRRALREAEYGSLDDRDFLESISPIHHIDDIRAPLLVVHGENDSRVPVGEARQVVEALQARGAAVESLIFENEGHGVRHLENRLVMYRQMVDFFTRYLQTTHREPLERPHQKGEP
jgi:dipeptidyl aminopeptidase/acylaminoacyl peptidase